MLIVIFNFFSHAVVMPSCWTQNFPTSVHPSSLLIFISLVTHAVVMSSCVHFENIINKISKLYKKNNRIMKAEMFVLGLSVACRGEKKVWHKRLM